MTIPQKKLKILITGANGFLGNELLQTLGKKYEVFGTSRSLGSSNLFIADLTKKEEVNKLKLIFDPDVIIHAAGLKDIKKCELIPKLAYESNVLTTKNLCNVFNRKKIIYISTDYVFKGNKGQYKENDQPNPITNYGKSKKNGEEIGMKISPDFFTVVRTASIFSHNSSFIRFLDQMIKSKSKFDSYHDCIFSPTSIYQLSIAIEKILCKDFSKKIFHVAGEPISRFEFAKKYFQISNSDIKQIIKSENVNNKFLFKNLSLSTEESNKILNLQSISAEKALTHLKNNTN